MKGYLQALVRLRADRDVTKSHHSMSDTRGPDHWNSVHDCRRITGSESISLPVSQATPLISVSPAVLPGEGGGLCASESVSEYYCVKREDMQKALPPSLVWLSRTRS